MKVKIPAKNETIRNCTKLRRFLRPTQLFKAVQWWSNPCTQWLQVLQCDAFGGRIFMHVSQLRLVYRLHFFETSSSRNVNFSSGSKSRAFSYAASVCRSSFYVTTPGSLNWTHNCRISVKIVRSKDVENTPSVHIWYVKFLTSIATRKALTKIPSPMNKATARGTHPPFFGPVTNIPPQRIRLPADCLWLWLIAWT